MIQVKKYIVNIMRTNCYLIKEIESGVGIIVDPGGSSAKLDYDIQDCKEIKYILLTHGHFDHITRAVKYKNLTNSKIILGEQEKHFTTDTSLNLSGRFRRTTVSSFNADILVSDNDKIDFANTFIKAIHTPGHTIGSFCYIIQNMIFTGDTLMKGTVGRCDLPTGNIEKLNLSLERLFRMEGDYVVYPGHGEQTTLNNERETYKSIFNK